MVDGALWASVATGVFTVLAGLGGAQLSNLAQKRQRMADRFEGRRIEQREAVVEVLVAGRQWTSAAESIVMAAAVISDPVEFAERPIVDQHGDNNKVVTRALTTARLVVTDPVLAPQLKLLTSAIEQFGELRLHPVRESARTLGKAAPEPIGKAQGYVNEINNVLDKLEASSLVRLT